MLPWHSEKCVRSLGVLPAIFLRERFKNVAAEEGEEKGSGVGHIIMDFLRGFGKTLSFKPFLKLCIATFLVFNGFILGAALAYKLNVGLIVGGTITIPHQRRAMRAWDALKNKAAD